MKQDECPQSPYKVACTYWTLPYDERTFRKVVERFGMKFGTDKAQRAFEGHLAAMARAYELRGLVRHFVLPDDATAYLPLVPELEDQLRRRFGLHDVVVVDAALLRESSRKGDDGSVRWQNKNDDLLHSHLGRWAGRVLAALVRPGDVVGTGGGRGPFYTARNCTIPPRSTYPKLVASLTGFISAGMWREDRDHTDEFVPRDVDADHVAGLLHIGLGTQDSPRLLNCPITANHPPPDTEDVTVALIGIGALGGGHRLKRLRHFDDLEPVKNLLVRLNAEVDAAEQSLREKGDFYHCVGDVCNTYFVLDELKHLLKAKVWKRLDNLVTAINSRFVNTAPEALARICQKGSVVAVAGGPHKVGAIASVLKSCEKGAQWITHLVTDDEVARRIIEEP